jgi:DNA polymerase-3 subunit delta
VLYGLRREGAAPALALWALVREINTLVAAWSRVDQGETIGRAMQELRVWRNRQPLLQRALRNHSEATIRRLVARAVATDRVVKGARPGQPWGALLELLLHIARPQQPVLDGYAS